jgi:hypothetical protein
MNKAINLVALLSVLLLSLQAIRVNADEVANLDKQNTTITVRTDGAKSFQADVILTPYHARSGAEPYQSDSFWGSSDTPPKTMIKSFTISFNSKNIVILRSVFDYLGNPTKLTISSVGSTATVKIFGGDAGGSYIATFKFTETRLVEKRIDSAEFPDEIYEKTQYVNKAMDSNR